jgi:hypothetical protein
LFIVYCLWFGVAASRVCGLLFGVWCFASRVCGLLYVVCCMWFVVWGFKPTEPTKPTEPFELIEPTKPTKLIEPFKPFKHFEHFWDLGFGQRKQSIII